MGRAITTDRWRYIEWEEGRAGFELYDHERDSYELNNVADDPRHAKLLRDLRRQLERTAKGAVPPVPFNKARL